MLNSEIRAPLRKCNYCGLEAHTEEELNLFKATLHGKHHRANLCKKCWNERWGRPYNRVHNPLNRTVQQKWAKENPEKIAEWGRRRRERARERYRTDPEYHEKMLEKSRNYQNNRNRTLRAEVIKKLGGKCVKCGCDVYEVLEINHINGGGQKDMSRKAQFYLEILNEKRKDIELTCKVCNIIHWLEYKGVRGHKVSWSPQ